VCICSLITACVFRCLFDFSILMDALVLFYGLHLVLLLFYFFIIIIIIIIIIILFFFFIFFIIFLLYYFTSSLFIVIWTVGLMQINE